MSNHFQRASDLCATAPPKDSSWIKPGVLPKGGTLILGGESAIGKSFLALEIARALSTGGRLFNDAKHFQVEPCNVAYMEYEIGRWFLHKRLYDLWGHKAPARLFISSRDYDIDPTDPTGLVRLHDTLKALDIKVLIIDPVAGLVVDTNSHTTVGSFFKSLGWLQHELSDLGIILIHHFRQPPINSDQRIGWDPLSAYNFTGSALWRDRPDTRVSMVREEGESAGERWRIKTRWLHRHAATPDLTLAVRHDFRVDLIGETNAVQPKSVRRKGRGISLADFNL